MKYMWCFNDSLYDCQLYREMRQRLWTIHTAGKRDIWINVTELISMELTASVLGKHILKTKKYQHSLDIREVSDFPYNLRRQFCPLESASVL